MSGNWFTALTSFANPAGTLVLALTGTFGGITPLDVPGFMVDQLQGACAAPGFSNCISKAHSCAQDKTTKQCSKIPHWESEKCIL